MRLHTFLFSALLAVPFGVLACASSADNGGVEELDSALSASLIQNLGSISQGQTLSASYTNTPKYRAYSFTAAKGDVVDFWVRSANGGDAYAYILRSTFSTVTSNHDAPGTKDAHVQATIATAGTYYLVFRDEALHDATFTVEFKMPSGAADAGAADAGTTDAGTTDAGMTDAGTTDAGDPFPTCDGTPTFPTTGPLRFSAAMKTTFARACDAFGVCTPWKSEGDRIVLEDNGVWSRALSPDGGLSLNTQVGFSTLSDGYDCRDTDIGSGMVSLTTGLGEGSMTAGYRCNISGGSGGPYGTDPQRAVSLRYGASCMAVTDKLPTPTTNFGTQRRSVIILYR